MPANIRQSTTEYGQMMARARWGAESRTVDRALSDIRARTAQVSERQAAELAQLAAELTGRAETEEESTE